MHINDNLEALALKEAMEDALEVHTNPSALGTKAIEMFHEDIASLIGTDFLPGKEVPYSNAMILVNELSKKANDLYQKDTTLKKVWDVFPIQEILDRAVYIMNSDQDWHNSQAAA